MFSTMTQTPILPALYADISNNPDYPDPQPYLGLVDNTVQAMRLVYAARQGVIPRTIRRLNIQERKTMLFSGAVFVFGEEESGMKRWTDGRLWSPSRISGNFLLYKELAANNDGPKSFNRFEQWILADGVSYSDTLNQQRQRHRPSSTLVNEGGTADINSGGLLKKTITVKINELDFHLISYYSEKDVDAGSLGVTSSRADIMGLDLPSNIFTFSEFRIPPRLEVGEDGLSRIVCEPEVPRLAMGPESVVSQEGTYSWSSDNPEVSHHQDAGLIRSLEDVTANHEATVGSSSSDALEESTQMQYDSVQHAMLEGYQSQWNSPRQSSQHAGQSEWGSVMTTDEPSLPQVQAGPLELRPQHAHQYGLSSVPSGSEFAEWEDSILDGSGQERFASSMADDAPTYSNRESAPYVGGKPSNWPSAISNDSSSRASDFYSSSQLTPPILPTQASEETSQEFAIFSHDSDPTHLASSSNVDSEGAYMFSPNSQMYDTVQQEEEHEMYRSIEERF